MPQSDFATLCVLSFNRRDFIVDTIKQLHERSGYPFELMVHDDGSNPDVLEALWELHDEGRISTLLLNPRGHNQGQGIALNRMFCAAKGDPIIKLDQDLIYAEGWLKRVAGLLASNDDDSPPSRYRAHEGTPLARPWEHPQGRGVETRLGLLGLLHYHHDPVDSAKTRIDQFQRWSSRTHILGSGFAVTRECWEALGPFEEHSDAFAEDWDFQNRVTNSAAFVCGLPNEDLVENVGMGIGPSTVNVAEGKVQQIHKEPVVYR